MPELSLLRITGLVAGILALAVAAARLRRHASQRTDVLALVVGGGLLCAISLSPNVVNLPAEAIELNDAPGGRLLTLLLASTFLMWPLLLRERGKSARLKLAFEESIRSQAAREFRVSTHGRELPAGAVWVIIPVLNEAENLRALLPQIPREVAGTPLSILVVNDGSTDESELVAREHGAEVANLPINRGGGAALKLGFELVRSVGASVAVTMDGDGQHRPEDLAGMVAPIVEGEADLVIGSRLLGSSEAASAMRAAGVHVFNATINLLMSTKITDCSSGFRAVRIESLRKLRLVQEQYHTAELIIEAAKHQLRIAERPITIVRRMSGQSKKGKDLLYGFLFLRTILKAWLR